MANVLTQPAEAPGGSPVRPRGVLAVALPAPDGWEQGGIQTSRTCPSPIVQDKCVTFTAEAGKPTVVEFPAFMIEQGSGCSTLSGTDRIREATDALNASTDYALGLTLFNGVANGGAPSLSDATSVGAAAPLLAALAALECEASEVGKGQAYVLHASPGAAVYLAEAGLIDSAGRSPSGAPWIISSGYDCTDAAGEYLIWATGRVWAAAGAIDAYDAVDRPTNNREAWAVRSAIVGFDTCINLSATFTTA